MSSPADSTAPAPLLDIPLEIRHHIFSHVAAARDVRPRYTLRYWFEKTDIREQIAKNLENDPDANVSYVAGYNRQYDYEDEPPVRDDAVVDGQEDDDEDHDQDDEDENEVDDEEQEQDVEEDNDVIDDDEDDDDELMADDVTAGAVADPNNAQGDDTAASSNAPTQLATGNTQALQSISAPTTVPTVAMADAQDESEIAVADPQAEQGVNDADMADAAGHDTTAGDDVGEAEAGGATASSDPPAPKVVVVRPHHKWRHVSKFMRLTQCPPQSNLFLISKQLNIEAKKWFYDVATLAIDATASFAHFSFFELALTKLAAAPFSPMENITNAEVTFVWDTTWIRAESTGFAAAVFPVFLKSRVDFIIEILLRAPELKKLKIHWHDSAQDDGAMQLRADTLEPFIMNLTAVVETEDHFIEPEAKPRAGSRAGKQRLEFKTLFDNGCETF